MPLLKGTSKTVFSKNLRELIHGGRSKKQALAIAYAQQRKSKRRKKHK